MEKASDVIGAPVYVNGKAIGTVTELLVDKREIAGLTGLTNTGIVRGKFFVGKRGILKMSRDAVLVAADALKYRKNFTEEYGRFGVYKENDLLSRVGDLYFDPATLTIESASVKKGFWDDLLYGRETVPMATATMTSKGFFSQNDD